MIASVGGSTGIGGTSRYLEKDPERVEWKESHNLASEDRHFVIEVMTKTVESSRTDQPIYHYSISWDEEDQPTKQQMIDTAKQTLQDLGLGEHQALIVAHNDHDYKHVHVMANRVHPVSGKAWDKWMDYKKLEKSLRGLERSRGWKEVPGHHGRLEGQKKPEYSQSLSQKEAGKVKDGQTPFFMLVRRNAKKDFREADSWKELHERLATKGLTIQRGSRGTGGKITDGHEYANLSKIHRDFSMGKLEKRFGKFRNFEQVQRGKGLSGLQETFIRFEKARRLNNKYGASVFKKSLGKALKGLSTARKVNGAVKSLLTVSTPNNPTFSIVKTMSKPIINQLKHQSKDQGRGI